jgi:hypothetical protein
MPAFLRLFSRRPPIILPDASFVLHAGNIAPGLRSP